jgi:hypothetical protein
MVGVARVICLSKAYSSRWLSESSAVAGEIHHHELRALRQVAHPVVRCNRFVMWLSGRNSNSILLFQFGLCGRVFQRVVCFVILLI